MRNTLFILLLCTLVSSCLPIVKTEGTVNYTCEEKPSEENCLIFADEFNYADGSSVEDVNPSKWKRMSY